MNLVLQKPTFFVTFGVLSLDFTCVKFTPFNKRQEQTKMKGNRRRVNFVFSFYHHVDNIFVMPLFTSKFCSAK